MTRSNILTAVPRRIGGGLRSLQLVLMTAMLTMVGCLARPAQPTTPPRQPAGEWPYAPVSIEVHPLTRFWDTKDHGREVEARIELLDADGYSTRGVGRLEFVLLTGQGRPVESWVLSLSDLNINRAHFDNVTRTYLVRLSLPSEGVLDDVELEATLVLPNDKRLFSIATVGRPPASAGKPLKRVAQ